MIKRSRVSLCLVLFCSTLLLFPIISAHTAEPIPSKTPNQIDVTVIHVDKFGVYAPSIVFYWDTGLSKQKADALMRIAEQCRNKKAVITYLASGDLSKDKRPLLVDIAPYREESKSAKKQSTDKESQVSSVGRDEKSERFSWREEQNPAQSQFDPEDEESEALPEPDDFKPIETASPSSTSISRDEVIRFIERLLQLNETKDLSSIMTYYADRVNYYDRGVVPRDYIRKDMGYYFKNWTRIASALDSDVVLIVTDQQDMRIAKFITRYQVENARKLILGRVENVWQIQRIGSELKIVDQKQRILSSETR